MHHTSSLIKGVSIFLVFSTLVCGIFAVRYFAVPRSLTDHELVPLKVGEEQLSVEYVSSPESITQGLSGRAHVTGEGMLFALPRRHVPVFWMKQMKFSLDFIWIDTDSVVSVTKNVPAPAPETPDELLLLYSSQVPVTHVLEVPAGFIDAKGIQVGQEVVLR